MILETVLTDSGALAQPVHPVSSPTFVTRDLATKSTDIAPLPETRGQKSRNCEGVELDMGEGSREQGYKLFGGR